MHLQNTATSGVVAAKSDLIYSKIQRAYKKGLLLRFPTSYQHRVQVNEFLNSIPGYRFENIDRRVSQEKNLKIVLAKRERD